MMGGLEVIDHHVALCPVRRGAPLEKWGAGCFGGRGRADIAHSKQAQQQAPYGRVTERRTVRSKQGVLLSASCFSANISRSSSEQYSAAFIR